MRPTLSVNSEVNKKTANQCWSWRGIADQVVESRAWTNRGLWTEKHLKQVSISIIGNEHYKKEKEEEKKGNVVRMAHSHAITTHYE